MGSATREALANVRATLDTQSGRAELQVAEELFSAERLLAANPAVRSAIADPTADPSARAQLARQIFASRVSESAAAVLVSVAGQRWSQGSDVLAALEELGIRVAAQSAPEGTNVENELFVVQGAVTSDANLELALRSKLAGAEAKAGVVDRLLDGKASPQTTAIVRQLVLQPRGRSIRESLRHAASIVADQSGQTIATVTSAKPLTPEQAERMRAGLAAQYDRDVKINQIIDPSVLGGFRVQIGDDVIDSTIAARLGELKLKLAG